MGTRSLQEEKFQKIPYFSSRIITNSLCGLALFLIIIINIFSFFQVSKFVNANQWVIHTYKVIQSASNGFLNLVQIESAELGFYITNDSRKIKDVEGKRSAMFQNFMATKELTIDNSAQQKNIFLIEKMLQERIEVVKKINQLVLDNNKNIEIKSLIEQSQELTKKISNLIQDISTTEQNLLEQRNRTSFKNLNELNSILLITSLVSIIFLVLGIILLNINQTRQERYLQEKRRYENLLGSIIDGTNDIVVVLDLDFRFIIFNHSFEHEFKSIFGKRPMIGKSIVETLSHLPEEQKKVANLWQRALRGEEFSIIGEFGTSSTNQSYECNFNSIYDENGALMGAAAICRNIEHRIKSEQILMTTNEKLEHAYDELKHHYTEISLLNEMENALQSCNSIDETLIIISKYCQKLLPFAAGTIYLINPSRNYLELMAEWSVTNRLEKVFSPNQCWGLRQGKNYMYVNNSTNIACEHKHNQSSLAYLCVPLFAQNEIIGMLHIEIINSQNSSEEEINELYAQHKLLIENLAVQLALAIGNIQLQEILKTRSIRDPLTSLYNRMYLKEFLERDLHRAQRNNFPVSIVMMDLDHFKKINDHYGHDAGDMVLKELGKLLQANTRTSDIVCRYGGEEFLLIFPETDIETSSTCIEKLRVLISHMEVHLQRTIINEITASFGLAVFPGDGASTESLITAADQALYQSKNKGRNRLTIYSEMGLRE